MSPRGSAVLTLVLACGLPSVGSAQAQFQPARSEDYLFASSVNDVRALWVNPAGLGIVREASLMGEFSLERRTTGDWRLGQYTLGLNSRGISLGFRRDRLPTFSNSIIRVGLGLGFPRGAFGAAVSIHRGTTNDRSLDLGLRLIPLPRVDLGVVLKNIGRPVIRGQKRFLSGVASGSFTVLPGLARVMAEAHALERGQVSGYNMSYRAGALVAAGRSLPVGALATFELGDNLKINRWTVGVVIGAERRALAVGSFTPSGGSASFDDLSITGLASRVVAGPRR